MASITANLIDDSTYVINSTTTNGDTDNTVALGLASNSTLIVDGVNVDISSFANVGVITSTTIEAINGAHVTVNPGTLSLTGGTTLTYAIGANSTIEVDASLVSVSLLSGVTIDFADANGTGTFIYNAGGINLSLSTPPSIVNLQSGDKIEVDGANSYGLSGNTLTFYGALGPLTPLASYTVPAGTTVSFDNNTDTLTFTSCFLRGTNIRTPEGDIPVEELRVGDLVVTCSGQGVAPILWVGRRRLDPMALDKPRDTLPIRILAGAIAENVPERDLLVSPDHCMFLEGSLIPAKFLINGTSITQEMVLTPFEYYHIELEKHDLVLAEGARTETYLDLAGRRSFLEPGVVQFGSFAATRNWGDWCFPPVYDGEVLDRARAALTKRAEELGFSTKIAKAS